VPRRRHDISLLRQWGAGRIARGQEVACALGVNPMHSRITIGALLAVALLGPATDAHAIECRSEKGDGYPWAWRLIDGKRCWYKGRAGMDKKLLSWPATTPASAAPATAAPIAARKRRASVVVIDDTAERDDLLYSYWPLLPPADIFDDRFDGIRARRQ
jgi:hypothetical protein